MTKAELNDKTEKIVNEIKTALQTVYNAMNQGQQKKIIKNNTVKEVFDRYGVEYDGGD